MRDIPNRLRYPRTRPETPQRFRTRTGDALRGNEFNLLWASYFSPGLAAWFLTTAFKVRRCSAYFATNCLHFSFPN